MKIPLVLIAVASVVSAQVNINGGTLGSLPGTVPPPTQMFSGRIIGGANVTGLPYSAQEVNEHIQTLADGTRITQNSQQRMMYRDSLGRTRIEHTFRPAGASAADPQILNSVEILDPVSGMRYSLDVRNHIVRQFSQTPGPQPLGIVSKSASQPTVQANRQGIVNAAGAVVSSLPQATERPQPQIRREALGSKTIEGVVAEGNRTTVTYPVGFFGNDRPVVTTNEVWTSPELKMNVLSRIFDPRSGETTIHLINISRAEPDPSLFQVPLDYEVVNNNSR